MIYLKKTHKKQSIKTTLKRGVSLFDTLVFIIMSMAVYSTYLQSREDTQTSVTADSIGSTISDVKNAGVQWMKDNSSALMQQMSDGQIVSVPFTGINGPFANTSALFPSDDVPNNYSPNLPYGQKLAYLVKKVAANGTNSPEHLESLITSYGGVGYDNKLLESTAEKMGITGGVILNHYKDITSTTGTIQGTYGSWSYPSQYWTANDGNNDYTPKTGHIAMIGNNYGGVVTEFLNRYYTGDINANTMNTNYDANNFSINTVNTVNKSTSIGLTGQILTLGTTANNLVMPYDLTVCDQSHTGCGVVLAQGTSLMNDNVGWTTLTTGKTSGLYIGGINKPSVRVQTGVFTGASGVTFNANSTSGYGANLSSVGNNLIISRANRYAGANGFVGLNISPQSSNYAIIQMLQSRIYGDSNGNMALQVPSVVGAQVAPTHIDGSLSDMAANAANLGTSSDMSKDGNSYPAYITYGGQQNSIIGGPCAPNGRIASSTDGQGALLTCVAGRWYNQAMQAFNYHLYSGSARGYVQNTTNYAQFIELTYDMNNQAWSCDEARLNLNIYDGVINGNVCTDYHDNAGSCHKGDAIIGSYTCSAIVPPHATVNYAGTLSTTCYRYHHHGHKRYACYDITPWANVYGSFPDLNH